jgi:hypothetical protein
MQIRDFKKLPTKMPTKVFREAKNPLFKRVSSGLGERI